MESSARGRGGVSLWGSLGEVTRGDSLGLANRLDYDRLGKDMLSLAGLG